MIRQLTVIFFFSLASSSVLFSQSVYTPDKGSPERAAILGALRVPVEKTLKQKIVFVTDNFHVQGNWAFVGGEPQTPAGAEPDYRGTRYAGYQDAFDNNFFALLKKTAGKWKVVTYAIGCTDVCYLDWGRRYKAPKAIFPHTEE